MADRRKVLAEALRAADQAPAEADGACFPHPAVVPDWSEATLALFEPLSVLERAFVEWYVAGGNAAEAYRRATGAEYTDRETDSTRKMGYKLAARPRVKVAVDAAMKDRNFNARCDLEWKLSKIKKAIAKCEDMDSLQAQQAVADLTIKLATLQGEIKRDDESGLDKRSNVRVRVLEIIAEAVGVHGGPEAANLQGPGRAAGPAAHPAVGADQLPAGGDVAKRGG